LPPEVLLKKGSNKALTESQQMDIDMQSATGPKIDGDINFEFKLVPFADEDAYLKMAELPKKLKYANKQKTILTVKKHIHNYLEEPIDNIEILCKNFPVADSHTLDFIKKTKWQNANKCLVLMYRRKKRIISNQNKQ
jgi:hypothetical protein